MDDKKFDDLTIHMTILPEAHKWPSPDYAHWQRLHALADEARSRVAKAFAALDEIDHNPDLTVGAMLCRVVRLQFRLQTIYEPMSAYRVLAGDPLVGHPRAACPRT
jgi:hypothetical protein